MHNAEMSVLGFWQTVVQFIVLKEIATTEEHWCKVEQAAIRHKQASEAV